MTKPKLVKINIKLVYKGMKLRPSHTAKKFLNKINQISKHVALLEPMQRPQNEGVSNLAFDHHLNSGILTRT